tara:strand:- start:482 stop:769 length:288 start_codon:yes stop_codon:yes gene_type:complete
MDDITTVVAEVLELNGKFERVLDAIEVVKDKQDDMAADVSKIREAVYNPDEGIYARLRELEGWKNTSTKLIWLIITSLVALTTAAMWSQLLGPGG